MATSGIPAIRACIFDLDGLLINSEDMVTYSMNQVLERYGRAPIPRSIRVQLMGIPDSSNGDVFHDWAKLSITRKQWAEESSQQMQQNFLDCEPLPGAEKLVSHLSRSQSNPFGEPIRLALASSTKSHTYTLKTSRPETKHLLSFFPSESRILGDDARVRTGRGKPAPDIYLVALEVLNASAAASGERLITPNECLVFEDSVVGVQAGRRAGMRVIWVPHADIVGEYGSRLKNMIAGRLGQSKLENNEQFGVTDDGFVEVISSLEDFNYKEYGIHLGPRASLIAAHDDCLP